MTTDPPDLPRLLVLAHGVPQTVYAGPILLHRLLRDYPPDRLVAMGPPPHPDAELLACRYETAVPPLTRLHTTRLAGWKRALDAFGVTPNLTPAAVRRRLRGFRPQVVVTVMQERLAAAAAAYAADAGVPLVLIVHDRPELFDPVPACARRRQAAANGAVYRAAAVRLNVSPEMERHLHTAHGVPGDVMYPNRSEDIVARPAADAATLRDPPRLRVGYAGTQMYGYGHQLRRLAAALRGTGVRLRVYGNVNPTTDPLATDHADVVDCRGLLPTPARLWAAVQAECDAVILPYPWDATDTPPELYGTHFPSKLTEYLALGLPTVIMGPPFATGVAWGLRNPDAALTLSADDPAGWAAALTALRDDPARRVALARAAVLAADRDFDPVRIRRTFLDHLRRVANNVPVSTPAEAGV